MSLSVFGQKLTGMEHIVTYVERRLVKFIQETFTKQDNSGVDKDCRDCRTQQQTCRQQSRAPSYMDYDFQSRPIEMSGCRAGHKTKIFLNSREEAESSSGADLSSTEDLESGEHRTTRRKRTFYRRNKVSGDELLFGIEM